MNQQDELAGRIARFLDEGADELAPAKRERLFEARRLALLRATERELEPAWAGVAGITERSVLGVRYLVPVAALVLGLIGVVYVNTTGGTSNDIADIDVGLLTDELPINAFLDQGLDSWLKRSPR